MNDVMIRANGASHAPAEAGDSDEPTIPADVLEKLRAEHGQLLVMTAQGYVVATRSLKRAEAAELRQRAADPTRRHTMAERAFWDTVVYPDKDATKAMVDARPFIVDSFGGQVIEAAGLDPKVTVKKY